MQTNQQSWWTPTSSLPLCLSTFPWGPADDGTLEWLPQTPHSQLQTVTHDWTYTMICSTASKSAHSAANCHAMKCSISELAKKDYQWNGQSQNACESVWPSSSKTSGFLNCNGWWNGITQITHPSYSNQTDLWLCRVEKEYARSQEMTEQAKANRVFTLVFSAC